MTFNYEEIASLDYFDSRDVVERIAQIDKDVAEALGKDLPHAAAHLTAERTVLHTLLEKLAEEFPPSKWMDVRTDTDCGVSGFAEHYAEEYAEEYTYDTGAVERGSWVERYIDWAKVAESLKEDYTEVAIARVRELHECFEAPNGYRWCSGCSTDEYPEDWPCGTIEALKGAPEPVDHSELISEARAYWENNADSGLKGPELASRLADALEGKNQ